MIRFTRPAVAGLLLAAGACGVQKGSARDGHDPMPKPDGPTAAAATTTTPAAEQVDGAEHGRVRLGRDDGEIQVAKLAETKAGNADVKAFAKMLVADPAPKMLNDVKGLATRDLGHARHDDGRREDLMGHSRDELERT